MTFNSQERGTKMKVAQELIIKVHEINEKVLSLLADIIYIKSTSICKVLKSNVRNVAFTKIMVSCSLSFAVFSISNK